MDWSSRMAASGRLTHTGPPLTMRTLWIAVIKAHEIQGCYQMLNAFNAYGIDHVVLVKLAYAAVVSWLLGLTEEQTMACNSHVWMDGQPTRVYRARDNTIPRKGWSAGDAGRKASSLYTFRRASQVRQELCHRSHGSALGYSEKQASTSLGHLVLGRSRTCFSRPCRWRAMRYPLWK